MSAVFEAHMESYHGGWTVWIHRVGEDADYLRASASDYCFTAWGAKLWARRKARQLAKTSWQIEVTR